MTLGEGPLWNRATVRKPSRSTGQQNDFELTLTVKMETRSPNKAILIMNSGDL